MWNTVRKHKYLQGRESVALACGLLLAGGEQLSSRSCLLAEASIGGLILICTFWEPDRFPSLLIGLIQCLSYPVVSLI